MKKFFTTLLILACLLAVGFSVSCHSGTAQEIQEDSANSMALDLVAIAAFQRKDIEEAGVLFLKSKLRFQLDRIVYPPVGKGSSAPGVLKSAMSSMLGTSILKTVKAEPKVLLRVIERLEKWEPRFPPNYDPGWKYKSKFTDAEIEKAITQVREKMLPVLRKQATLLADERYQRTLSELGSIRKEINTTMSSEVVDYQKIVQLRKTERAHLTKLFEIEWELTPGSRWHKKVGWKAEDFFEDSEVIEFCKAIEENRLQKIQELIDNGVNVNAKGKGNMTPLLWSYPDLKFERFQMLLDAGADPNVVVASDFGIERQKIHPTVTPYRGIVYERLREGSSANLMAFQANDSRYAWSVLKHGGDVNQIEAATGQAPLHLVLAQFSNHSDLNEMFEALIEKGADIDLPDPYRGSKTVLQIAISKNRFELAVLLLKLGANVNNIGTGKHPQSPAKLALQKEAYVRPTKLLQYKELLRVMVEHGADLDKARAKLNEGSAWGKARNRQTELRDLRRRLTSERKYPKGKVAVYEPRKKHFRWSDYTNQSRNREWSKYYQHTSPDCVRPPSSSAIAFSIKHVTQNELQNVGTSLPEFAAMGDKTVLFSPALSGHTNWLDGYGGVHVDYLRHLVVKKCQLMDKTAKDFPELKNNHEGFYFLEIADDKRHHELLIPAQYLREDEIRRDAGLETFKEVWEVIEMLKLRATVGDVQQTGALFQEVNQQLKSTFPDAQSRFYIHHLKKASRNAPGDLSCTIEFTRPIAPTLSHIYTANCERVGDDIKIKITRQNEGEKMTPRPDDGN